MYTKLLRYNQIYYMLTKTVFLTLYPGLPNSANKWDIYIYMYIYIE
jgi:hypothetical protein